ncbi:U3 small nucleolar RNA-associated protein 15 homolog [Amia ocellicauda]|uniref:U3 small nucleolar RNA-associated protein 15 homolog n=1 Tax=Amia ocellicauda TaxID=2972642 RepID=UPI003464791E
MTSFKPTKIQTYPRLGEKVTQDTLYWKNYKTPVQIKEFGAITKIDVSPLPPYNYAITASTRIHIYGRYSQEPVKNFSRFKDTAYCGTYRCDGQLLVAGSEDASVRLFDVSGRVALRQFSGHTKAVHVTDFTSDRYRILSGSDDYTCRLWDIPNSEELISYREHTDYVRCGTTSKLNPDLFITGSYDHTVKVFDARTERGVMTMDHGQPVESVLLFPSEGLLVSAGGRYLKVWDMLKGGQQLVSLKNHHKTVTCLCLSSSGQRLLSGSLDRHVKVYSTTTYKVVHSFDYASSILSVALAPDDEAVIVGMTNGVLSVKHKKHPEESVPAAGKRRRPAYRFLVKGKNYVPKQDDLLVSKPVKAHLRKYDKQLKSFQVSKALDTVLETRIRVKSPEVTVAVMQELNRRGTLRNALAGREEKSLSLLLSFLIRHVVDPRFAPVLVNVAEIILDIYVRVVGQSAVIDRQVVKLQELIEKEIDYQEELVEVLGMMDTLFATMTVRKEAAAPDRASAALEPVGQRDQLEAA